MLCVENQINVKLINVNGRSVILALAIIILVSEVFAVVFYSGIIIVEVSKRLVRASIFSLVVITTVWVEGVFVIWIVFGISLSVTIGIIVATCVCSLLITCKWRKSFKQEILEKIMWSHYRYFRIQFVCIRFHNPDFRIRSVGIRFVHIQFHNPGFRNRFGRNHGSFCTLRKMVAYNRSPNVGIHTPFAYTRTLFKEKRD